MREIREAFNFLRNCIDNEPHNIPRRFGNYDVEYHIMDDGTPDPTYALIFKSHPVVKSLHTFEHNGTIHYVATLKSLTTKPDDLQRSRVRMRLLDLGIPVKRKKLKGWPTKSGSDTGAASAATIEMARGPITLASRYGKHLALIHSDPEEIIRELQKHKATIIELGRKP